MLRNVGAEGKAKAYLSTAGSPGSVPGDGSVLHSLVSVGFGAFLLGGGGQAKHISYTQLHFMLLPELPEVVGLILLGQ